MRTARHSTSLRLRAFGAVALFALALPAAGHAQEAPRHRHHVKAIHVADAHPLTVRRLYRPAPVVGEDFAVAPGFVRAWNDPRLDTFWGWRLGGDNFYGDERGDPVSRGNASLGMIDEYGGARGGYGGPHFDSVGGFHDGAGPGAQEAADYASGSIWRPVYDRPQPRYPSVRAQVAALDTGIAGTGQVERSSTLHARWTSLARTRATTATPMPDDSAPEADEPDDAPDF